LPMIRTQAVTIVGAGVLDVILSSDLMASETCHRQLLRLAQSPAISARIASTQANPHVSILGTEPFTVIAGPRLTDYQKREPELALKDDANDTGQSARQDDGPRAG
jgi:hypothetical protein